MSSFCTQCGSSKAANLPGVEAGLSGFVDEGDITPGIQKLIIADTLTAKKFRTLTSVRVASVQHGEAEVFHTPDGGGAIKIASGTFKKGHDFDYSWFPFKTIGPLDKVEVFFTLFNWSAASDVEAFLQNTLADV